MIFNKTKFLFFPIVFFSFFIFVSNVSASWYVCNTTEASYLTCKESETSGCLKGMYDSLEVCKTNITGKYASKYIDENGLKLIEQQKQADIKAAAEKQAQAVAAQLQAEQAEIAKQKAEKEAIAQQLQAQQEAEAKQAAIDAENKAQNAEGKKIQEAETAKASGLVCDCSKKSGQCKDDFTYTQEAVEYCNACGLSAPQTLVNGCPLGSKEIGPFFCSCGAGEKAVCSSYDTFSELDSKCSKNCGRGNGSCPVDTSASLKKLQKEAKILNPAGFAFGSAGVIEIMGKAINMLMYSLGMFVMALYIYAGFLWMTAQGKSENVEKAKTIIVWTTLGFIVTLASYLIVKLVFTEIL